MNTIKKWQERLKYPNQSFFSEREEARDAEIEELRAHVNSQQAKIDRLMLEFCPNEMSEEQKKEWAKHQRVVPGSREAVQEALYSRIENTMISAEEYK